MPAVGLTTPKKATRSPQLGTSQGAAAMESPSGHIDAPDRVVKWVEYLEGSSRPVIHDVDVLGPASLMVEEEAEASNGVRRVNHIVGVDCWMREARIPFQADLIASPEFVGDRFSVFCASEDDAVIDVHTERRVVPVLHLVKEWRGVND